MKIKLDMLDDIISTKLSEFVINDIGTKYHLTDDNFTINDTSPSNPVLPSIYLSLLPSFETNTDLEATTLHGGLFTFQVDVYDNVSQDEATKIMNSVVKGMKMMAFKVTSMPTFNNQNSIFRKTARFQRAIDDGDTL